MIIRLLLGCGILCTSALWLFEGRFGLLSEYDRYGYPLLLTGFGLSFGLLLAVPRLRAVAEIIGYSTFVLYCACAVLAFPTLPTNTRLYTIANTLQWMPLIYVTAFLLFKQRKAMLAAGGAFGLSLAALAWTVATGTAGTWSAIHASLILNAYAVHLLTLLALSLFVVTQSAFERMRKRTLVLESAAFSDALTGVANRRGLERILMRHAEQPGMPMALILLDMDHFKRVNDRRGHVFGDRVLQTVVDALGGALRADDLLGRWGGDEFLVLADGTSVEDARALAERLRSAAAALPASASGGVTLSAGVSLWDGEGGLEEALRRVDIALYAAKNQGRDRVAMAETTIHGTTRAKV
ncbi:GGDEF domain-containing protein [Aquabacter cavernae]|uniref:GGDEF domain-containing protein n=1 Tax=Aquabacter cavernae TaxID=2496029 RepID=UPI0013DEBF22|nr:GGDEF domain-containing protein [Aquabacter cavernae]